MSRLLLAAVMLPFGLGFFVAVLVGVAVYALTRSLLERAYR